MKTNPAPTLAPRNGPKPDQATERTQSGKRHDGTDPIRPPFDSATERTQSDTRRDGANPIERSVAGAAITGPGWAVDPYPGDPSP